MHKFVLTQQKNTVIIKHSLSLTKQRLACGLPWLQTLSCNSLLILNKFIFLDRYLAVYLFQVKILMDYGDQRRLHVLRAHKQTGVVPTTEHIVRHCFSC